MIDIQSSVFHVIATCSRQHFTSGTTSTT